MTQNYTLKAIFEPIEYTLKISTNGNPNTDADIIVFKNETGSYFDLRAPQPRSTIIPSASINFNIEDSLNIEASSSVEDLEFIRWTLINNFGLSEETRINSTDNPIEITQLNNISLIATYTEPDTFNTLFIRIFRVGIIAELIRTI